MVVVLVVALPLSCDSDAEVSPRASICIVPVRLSPVAVSVARSMTTTRSPGMRASRAIVPVMTRHSVNPASGVHPVDEA